MSKCEIVHEEAAELSVLAMVATNDLVLEGSEGKTTSSSLCMVGNN